MKYWSVGKVADTLCGYCEALNGLAVEGEEPLDFPERRKALALIEGGRIDTGDVCGRFSDTSETAAARRTRVRIAREAVQFIGRRLREEGLLASAAEAE